MSLQCEPIFFVFRERPGLVFERGKFFNPLKTVRILLYIPTNLGPKTHRPMT